MPQRSDLAQVNDVRLKDNAVSLRKRIGSAQTDAINPHEDKTLTQAELLAANRRHELKRKCCGHPCHQNGSLMPNHL